jgi:hypothetical protein
MESLQINVNVQGEEIAFLYRQDIVDDLWSGVIIDECSTIEERLVARSVDGCLDGLVPFLEQLGNVVSITSAEGNSPYVGMLQRKLKRTG